MYQFSRFLIRTNHTFLGNNVTCARKGFSSSLKRLVKWNNIAYLCTISTSRYSFFSLCLSLPNLFFFWVSIVLLKKMMKYMKQLHLVFLTVLVLSCGKSPRTLHLTLTNPSDTVRIDEAFVLSREQLCIDNHCQLVPVIKDELGKFIPCQYDDLDDDGSWDAFAFVCDLLPLSQVRLQIDWVSSEKYPSFLSRTNVRYGKMISPRSIVELKTDWHDGRNLPRGEGYPYQLDGPAWENDKVGFRHYFDGRNNRDVFGKLLPAMVLDTVGITLEGVPGDTYNVMRNWGRDILIVGRSLGLGGIALQLPDTLLRLGVLSEQTVDNVDSTRYTLIAEGPVRSMLKLNYHGWKVGESKVDLQEIITIWAGKYGYESQITTSRLPENAFLVTGLVNIENEQTEVTQKYCNKYLSMSTHDLQANRKTWYLGLSLILPAANVDSLFEAPRENSNIMNTWCVRMKPDAAGEYRYNAYAAWEMSDQRFCSRDFYLKMIDGYAEAMCRPVKMEIAP